MTYTESPIDHRPNPNLLSERDVLDPETCWTPEDLDAYAQEQEEWARDAVHAETQRLWNER